jgi:hypothetical protein
MKTRSDEDYKDRDAVCNARMRNWIFVKVVTTSPDSTAGARRRSNGHRAVTGAIEDISQLVGEDPPDRTSLADDVPPALLALPTASSGPPR